MLSGVLRRALSEQELNFGDVELGEEQGCN